ncbi:MULTISPECIES: glutaredoxin family protein [unclassified Brevibacterium]|uniref:glutaredoxin family protein n=1 Tax=unclassified Brevibacterium TaxID=2614124 RepID=UPI0022A9CC76|nr:MULTISPECIES: glutaredoxin family protein [unclassified Brevibacterium]MCD1287311.1 NrdH-redoxin [Brevibacterium sp. CCUG 69071]MDK8436435.1 glutaredoxin family protein [Brevibacterium sp. H-BE7]
MAITVYSTEFCTQCRMTKHILERDGIVYTHVDLSSDLDAYRFVTRELGHSSAPVVFAVFPDEHVEHWSGLQPQRLEKYIEATKTGAAA